MLLDVSLSMPALGCWTAAHQDAMALVHELQAPDSPHRLKAVIAFSDLARTVDAAELADMEWDRVHGSNLEAALHLALSELKSEPGRIVILSDMEATAHTGFHGKVSFSYPPARVTAKKTVQAVTRCLSTGTQLEIRRYRDEFGTGITGAEALTQDVARLGGTVTDVVVPSQTSKARSNR